MERNIYQKGEENILGKVIVSFVGVVLFIFGMYQSRKRVTFIKEGEEIEAEIYGYHKHMNRTWSYVYAYTLPGGKKIVAEENIYHQDKQRRRKAVGEKVKIVYNPNKPAEFKTKHQFGIMAGFYIMMIMGIFYMVLGIFII